MWISLGREHKKQGLRIQVSSVSVRNVAVCEWFPSSHRSSLLPRSGRPTVGGPWVEPSLSLCVLVTLPVSAAEWLSLLWMILGGMTVGGLMNHSHNVLFPDYSPLFVCFGETLHFGSSDCNLPDVLGVFATSWTTLRYLIL